MYSAGAFHHPGRDLKRSVISGLKSTAGDRDSTANAGRRSCALMRRARASVGPVAITARPAQIPRRNPTMQPSFSNRDEVRGSSLTLRAGIAFFAAGFAWRGVGLAVRDGHVVKAARAADTDKVGRRVVIKRQRRAIAADDQLALRLLLSAVCSVAVALVPATARVVACCSHGVARPELRS